MIGQNWSRGPCPTPPEIDSDSGGDKTIEMWWGGGERKQLKFGGLGSGGGAKQQKNGFDEVPSKTKHIHRPKNN